MTFHLDHGDRRFQVLPYHDAVRHDGPALELAELVDGEVGPEIVTVLLSPDDVDAGEARVLLTDGSLPLSVIMAFLEEAVREQRRLGQQMSQERK